MLDFVLSLTLAQVLAVTAYGLCLIALCAAVVFLIYKIIAAAVSALRRPAAQQPTPSDSRQADPDQLAAILICAVSQAVGLPPERFRITSIRQID